MNKKLVLWPQINNEYLIYKPDMKCSPHIGLFAVGCQFSSLITTIRLLHLSGNLLEIYEMLNHVYHLSDWYIQLHSMSQAYLSDICSKNKDVAFGNTASLFDRQYSGVNKNHMTCDVSSKTVTYFVETFKVSWLIF